MRKLVLMRGIPGSGKSTRARGLALQHWAKKISSVAICSTDDYHMEGDEYVFKGDKLGEFHAANQRRAYNLMKLGVELVIIDNTNIRKKDMDNYVAAGKEFGYEIHEEIVGAEVLCAGLDTDPYKFRDYIDMCAARNTHGVPRDVIERMARSFEA